MESAQEIIKKIPIALINLGVKESYPQLCNYIHNVILSCLQDPELQRRLHEDPPALIEELSKV